MTIPPLRQLRQTVQRRTSNAYDTLFTRRVSIYFTALLARVHTHPDLVSVIALVCGLASCLMLASALSPWVYVGVGLLHLHQVLDSVDGELARLYQRPSQRGMFLEDLSAYLLINTYFLAFGAYLWRRDQDLWPLALAVLVVACGRNAMPVVRRVMLLALRRSQPTSAVSASPSAGGGGLGLLRRLIEERVLHYTNVRVVLSTALLVEHAFPVARVGALRWLLFGYLGLQMLKELGTVALYLRAGAIEREVSDLRAVCREESSEVEG